MERTCSATEGSGGLGGVGLGGLGGMGADCVGREGVLDNGELKKKNPGHKFTQPQRYANKSAWVIEDCGRHHLCT